VLYADYTDFCRTRGLKVLDHKAWGRAMGRRFRRRQVRRGRRRVRVWREVRLKESRDVPEGPDYWTCRMGKRYLRYGLPPLRGGIGVGGIVVPMGKLPPFRLRAGSRRDSPGVRLSGPTDGGSAPWRTRRYGRK
jgi:hypothetical protein